MSVPNFIPDKIRSLANRGMQSRGAKRGIWALADQAVVSLGNFATLTLMIRYVAKDDFARFGLLFEVTLYLNSFQAALVTFPLTVRGAASSALRLKKLATGCLLFTLMMAPVLAILMGVASTLISTLSIVPLAMASMLCWQAQETTRRALLSQFRYMTVLPGDAINYLGQALLILILAKTNHLTIANALMAMAATSVAGAVLQALQIGLAKINWADLKEMAVDFWSFGRWSLCTSMSTVFTDFSFGWLLAAHFGLAESAAFQVMGNMTKPCNIVISAIPNVATPAAARARTEGGVAAGWRTALRYFALGAVVLSPYVLLLLIWPQGLMKLLYHSNAGSYLQYSNLARFNVLALLGGYVANGLGTYLNAMEETRSNFISSVANTIAVFLIGMPLTFFGGLWGAIIGCTVCVMVRLGCNLFFVRRVKDSTLAIDDGATPVVMPGPAIDADISTAEATAVTPAKVPA